jgi:hypothetical protein
MVGGTQAVVQFAGLTPGFVGLAQIRRGKADPDDGARQRGIKLPATLPAGSSLPLIIQSGSATSTPVNLLVRGSGTGGGPAVKLSDSFDRADAPGCSLGVADLAQGCAGSHYYLPVLSSSAGIVSHALRNTGSDYTSVQFSARRRPQGRTRPPQRPQAPYLHRRHFVAAP